MVNTLAAYNPVFYAQEALIELEKALGLAARVHRGYDASPQQKGSTITISKPSTFTAQDAPSTAQDITASSINITLDQWKEVKFKLTDKELSHTKEKIIEDHIRPAAYALADTIDQAIAALYKDVPWVSNATNPAAVADITAVQRILFDNKVPSGNRHMMISGKLLEQFLNLTAFSQWQGAGAAGVDSQMNGALGVKYGFETFPNQNTPTHTTGTCADATGYASGAHASGATTLLVDGVTLGGTVVDGDTLAIAGHTQRYVITANATAGAGTPGVFTLTISPGLTAALSGNEVVTMTLQSGVQSIAFHRNAFALAMAPLSDLAKELGAKVTTIVDPITNLALRSRIYYVGNSSEVHVALDCLYGVRTLDGNLACRLVDTDG